MRFLLLALIIIVAIVGIVTLVDFLKSQRDDRVAAKDYVD